MPFFPNEKRKAVVIGINDYHDPDIRDLKGAVNDANDIYHNLSTFGDFEIKDEHYLLDGKATSQAIRAAISDLLWVTDTYDFVLFYFSGHGITDAYGNIYIAPHDVIGKKPLIHGISLKELRYIASQAVNKKTCIFILDCCYSGAIADNEKGGSVNSKTALDQCFVDFDDTTNKKGMRGEGLFFLASSSAEDTSREEEVEDIYTTGRHYHGIFTHHLLQGFSGGASDSEGVVTLGKLITKLNEALNIRIASSKATDAYAISILVCREKYEKNRENTCLLASQKLEDYKSSGNPSSLIFYAVALSRLPCIETDSSANDLYRQFLENITNDFENARKWFQKNRVQLTGMYLNASTVKIFNNIFGFRAEQLLILDNEKLNLLAWLLDAAASNMALDEFGRQLADFITIEIPRELPKSSSPGRVSS